MTANELMEALIGAGWISGQQLAQDFGVSRTAIWKHICTLREMGCDIERSKAKGYMLKGGIAATGAITRRLLNAEEIGKEIIFLPEVDSTNLETKRRSELEHGAVIMAGEQTCGRGRLGRGWVSEPGTGVYMTLFLKPKLPPHDIPALAIPASLSVVRAMHAFGIEAGIKWPNDIIYKGKKLCGILLEMSTDMSEVEYALIGIGINVKKSKDRPDTAISMEEAGYAAIDVPQAAAAVINSFEPLYKQFAAGNTQDMMEEYAACSLTLQKTVVIKTPKGQYEAKAVGITKDGALEVLREGRRETVVAGEVSVRGLMGYV
ncbi:MAG: biotin--[acetyl-CoA-carboxylase] ligase [Christensenellales bacterium]|jgi:BirA family biotin operon repressor/biotin-[acetyl-CoA-carboxylase] ligase